MKHIALERSAARSESFKTARNASDPEIRTLAAYDDNRNLCLKERDYVDLYA